MCVSLTLSPHPQVFHSLVISLHEIIARSNPLCDNVCDVYFALSELCNVKSEGTFRPICALVRIVYCWKFSTGPNFCLFRKNKFAKINLLAYASCMAGSRSSIQHSAAPYSTRQLLDPAPVTTLAYQNLKKFGVLISGILKHFYKIFDFQNIPVIKIYVMYVHVHVRVCIMFCSDDL